MSAPRRDCPECGGAGWVFATTVTRYGTEIGIEASCPLCCRPAPGGVRAWREAHGWSPSTALCHYCGRSTHLHDEYGYPAHLVCAAVFLAREAEEVAG